MKLEMTVCACDGTAPAAFSGRIREIRKPWLGVLAVAFTVGQAPDAVFTADDNTTVSVRGAVPLP